MDTQQLLDALTDHMALYHCRKRQLERRQGHSSSKSDRRKVIEWLKGLSVKQRQIAFTVVDGAWVALILQMQKYLESEGPGVFFVLPDFPSKCPGAVKKQSAGVSNKFQAHGDASLPGLCFRRARGVLKRLAFRKRAEEFLTSSSRLFSSLDGEMSKDSIPNRSLDCLTVSYEFLDNVDEFLKAMDEISYGEFLARQCFSGGSSWEETPWLKSMGYYGLAAFIANRFEFSIWAAWVSALGTKQPSKAIPRTFARNAFEAATIASRVCTKRQGFEEWWNKLSVQEKSKALDCAIGKVSKFEAFKLVARKSRNAAVQVKQLTLRVKDDFSLDHLSNYKNSSLKQEVDRFAFVCLGIQFLREVADLRSVTSESNWLVCTPLASVHSSSECILQTVRNILVKVMNHSTEFDLLESGKALAHREHPCSKTIQPKGRKGKSKKQKRDAIRKSFACVEDQSLQSYRTNQIDGTAGEPQVVEIHCQDSDWIPGKRKKKCKQGKKAKSEAIDACAKQGSEHTSSSCARLASDKSLQDRGVVKQWQMNNKTLLQVGTGDSEAKGSHDTVVTCESGPTRSEEAEPEFQHLTSTAASQGNARPVELALPVGGEDPKITYTTEIANQKTGSNELPSRPPYVKSNQAFRMQQQMPSFVMPISHEWPGAPKSRFSGVDSRGQSAATDWLHLDVSREWQHRLKPPLLAYRPAGRRQNGQVENMMQRSVLSKAATLSWDWPPMVQPGISLASPFGYSVRPKEEPTFISVGPVNMDGLARTGDDVELEEPLPDMDSDDVQGDRDDFVDGCVESDHQTEDVRQFYDMDYNQIFGGGVMYWTSADYTGMGYSRPGSLSSEDSSWARREADLTIVVDDIVGLPPVSAPYPGLSSGASTMTCTSPSSSCSLSFPFDHVAGNGSMFRGEEVGLVAGKADSLSSEHASQPVLPPIAVRESKLSGQASKLEAAKLREARSPHMPRGRRDFVRCKRSPSPVLRCVPPAPPPPPPPSPVGGMKKRRGFATVRSGSSSPRHWGVLSWSDNQDVQFAPEGILSTGWRTRCIPNTPPIHPLTGALLRERLVAIGLEQEHPDVAFPTQTSLLDKNNPTMHTMVARLHKEIEAFCLQVAAENAMRKPFITAAVKKVTHALQVLWPRSRTKIFGSNATGLALPNSDVDLVVCLPPVRNLEPIKEAGILEGRNGIKETCLQHAARYLADQDWVKNDSLKTIENTAIPIIMLVAKSFPDNLLNIHGKGTESDDFQSRPSKHVADSEANVKDEGGQENPPEKGPWGTKEDRHFVRLDISFESPSHTGLLTAELVKELVAQFPAISPLALVLKQFLMDRGLDQPYTGGLSSYCLVLLITRFLQHQHHLGWSSQNQSLGSLLMDFLHFFGCVFDPRRMCISIRGGGMYVNRERLHGIDPLHIEDPLHPTNNVGRNCFRILQCTKAFADAYATLEKELCDTSTEDESVLLQKILPSVLKDR